MNTAYAVKRFLSTLLFATGALLIGGVFIEDFLGSTSDESVLYGVAGALLLAGGIVLRRRTTTANGEEREESSPSK